MQLIISYNPYFLNLIYQINGEDVSTASHEHVIDLIRRSGSHVSMTVVSVNQWGSGGSGSGVLPASKSVVQLSHAQGPICSGARQYATLPRKASGAPGGRSPAPAPPRRDPRTTLSVGRARAKSMVAGLGMYKRYFIVTMFYNWIFFFSHI